GEHDIRTEPEPRVITVKLDQPPAFTKVSTVMKVVGGKLSAGDEVRVVPPYETLPIELSVVDDVGVDEAQLEYRINDGTSQFEPIELLGRGTLQATGRHSF